MTSETQRELADAYYPELARVGKAISSPTRLEILDLLRQGPRCVDEIADELGLSSANTSQHLRLLLQTHLVAREKEAQRVFYRVANNDVCRFFFALQTVADEQLAEVAEIRRDALDMPDNTTVEAVAELAISGAAFVVDVRPTPEFEAGHFAGAVSVPLPELETRVDEFPKDKDVIVYCRGVFCTLALEGVKQLRKHGIRAQRLPLGVLEMRSRHWRIEHCESALQTAPLPHTNSELRKKRKQR